MFNPSVAQPAYIAKDGDTLFQVSVEAQYDQQRLVVRQSRNDGASYQTAVIIPLADAVEFAKAMVRFVAETADATGEELEAIRRWEEAQDARHDALSAKWGHD